MMGHVWLLSTLPLMVIVSFVLMEGKENLYVLYFFHILLIFHQIFDEFQIGWMQSVF